ncbi:ankyrin-1-like [Bradysia coprophila]|uniref:ankyrin-1-like n=1 Tax=Bradysia coprophila TaxID=38358 RepID=UPI00187DA2E2|nr:ankyrin-1-like [Bradysia coprophila]
MELPIILCVLLHITSFHTVFMASDGNDQSGENSPLHDAVVDDNFLNVKKLISKGANKNAKNHFDRTPLHLAAERGFGNIVRLLVDSHAEIDTKDMYGKIPLFFAAQNGHVEVFRMLLQEYEDRKIDYLNATDMMGMSLLHYSAMNKQQNNTEILRILLRKGVTVNAVARDHTTPLVYAATTGNPDMVQLLLDSGAGVNVNLRDSTGDTPIMYAAYGSGEDRLKVFQLLLKKNADVNNVNNLGETTLFFLARFGGDDPKLAEFLILGGARINDANKVGETPLHYAARSGYVQIGESFIKNNANINAKTLESQTPLHYAVKFGQFEFAELLINNGANTNVADENHYTPLHYAVNAELGHPKILELLTNGVDINDAKKDGKSLLHLSIEKGGDMDTFKWLLEKGASVKATDRDGRSILHAAANYGRTDIVEWLIQNHHPIDEIINKPDNYGNTPLHYAIRGSHYELTKILLINRSEVNAMNNDFEFPMHLAALSGNENVVKLLNKYDATVNVRNRFYWTPLFYSVVSGNEKVVTVLIKHEDEDFSLNDMDAQGKTVVHICAKSGSVNIGKILHSYGANVSAIDEKGRTPLHVAAKWGNSDFVAWLINLQTDVHNQQNREIGGIDVNDKNGDTPLHLATRYGHEKTASVLIQKGSDVNKKNKNQSTPLHYAAENGYVNIAKTLLMHGAKINAKTSNNETAILLAIENGKPDVVDELLRNKADTNVHDDDEKTLLEVAKQQKNEETVNLLTKHDVRKKEEALIFHIFIVLIMILLVPLVIFIVLFFHKLCRKEATDGDTVLKLTDLLERYMFPQNQVMLSTRIGKGVFGTIYKGYAHKILHHENETLVAVKEVKSSGKEADSHTEAQKMLSLGSELKLLMQCGGHLNLVNLLGIVAENIAKHELMVIMEYCRYGNLKDVLEKHRQNVKNQNTDSNAMQVSKSRIAATAISVTRNNLSSWSYQVAQGMHFLSAQKIVHANLAARSIFLADGNIAKISDFGLARAMYKADAYIAEKESKLEYQWLSIESMQNRILTSKSDVWSFGVLLWEIFSFGETPYQDIEIYQLKRHIQNGHTLEKPAYANDNMYEIMQQCWRRNPESRPSFDSLEKWLSRLL